MSDEVRKNVKKEARLERDARLNAALRANLNKRKQQNRSREVDQADAPTDTQLDGKASDAPDAGER
ncbi:MAG TPA: hypothetical protein VIN57_04755 [Magnetovibrio sp.]